MQVVVDTSPWGGGNGYRVSMRGHEMFWSSIAMMVPQFTTVLNSVVSEVDLNNLKNV